jgi:hypothetical protein
LLIVGIIFESGLLALLGLENLTTQAGVYVGIAFILSGLFGLAVWFSFRTPTVSKEQLRLTLAVIIFFAVLFRLTSLFIAPTLSTDEFRYIWEGKLVTQGLSPYQYPPNAPALVAYRDEIWPLVQQKETASPYPPLAQLIGAVQNQLFGESLLGPKIVAVFFDLLNCLALLWLLRLYKLDLRRVMLYAWCPLPILEFGISGHNDAPMLFLLLLAIGLAVRRKPGLSAVLLGLAALAKFTALFGLPLFLVTWWQAKSGKAKQAFPRWNWQKLFQAGIWVYPLLTFGVIVAGYLPFLVIGGGAVGSLFEYTGSWRDNDSLVFQLVADFLGLGVAKVGSLIVLGLGGCLLAFHPRLAVELSLPRRLMLLFGLTLLVASTVHPWYVSWLLVLLPLVYRQGFKYWDLGWLLFAALVQLPYLTYAGDGSSYRWSKPLEYLPLYFLIALDLFKWWRNRVKVQTVQPQPLEGNAKNDAVA